jgi:glycine dehydrogenase subunit 2
MKHNPKINERVSSLEGFATAHPLAPEEFSRGSLRLIYELADSLSRITGMKAFSLIPAAGAHGELTSVMIIKKYFESLGQKRSVILIPDSAHGTNPASVAMCGFEVRSVPSKADGDVDLVALKALIDENVAAMMLTSPSTLGLFDRGITEIASMLHANGSIFYCDGANLNAVMGVANIADMGFDIMHINLHKTFSTPHGGGGPGSGPVGVVEKLLPFLPVPRVEKTGENYRFNYDCPSSIGRVHAFWGNFLIMVRAYAYIRMLGPEGVRSVSEHAVLNANYLRARLMKEYHLPKDRLCMHEFVLSDAGFPNHVSTNDISKRILDFGMHAPTVYFPLIVEGALMFEPTETESLEALDRLVDVMKQIKAEALENPDLVKNARIPRLYGAWIRFLLPGSPYSNGEMPEIQAVPFHELHVSVDLPSQEFHGHGIVRTVVDASQAQDASIPVHCSHSGINGRHGTGSYTGAAVNASGAVNPVIVYQEIAQCDGGISPEKIAHGKFPLYFSGNSPQGPVQGIMSEVSGLFSLFASGRLLYLRIRSVLPMDQVMA